MNKREKYQEAGYDDYCEAHDRPYNNECPECKERSVHETTEDVKKSVDEMDALLHKYIGKMFGSVDRASIEYFLQTGKLNGMFRLNLVRLVYAVMGDTQQQSRSQAIAFAEWIHRHAHWQHNGQWSTDVNAQRAHNAKHLFEIYQQFLIEQAKKEI